MLPQNSSAGSSSASAEQRLQHRPLRAHRWSVAAAPLCWVLGKHFAAFPRRHGGSFPPLCCIRQRGKKKKKKWERENRNPSIYLCKQIALRQEHTYRSAASSLDATCPEALLGALSVHTLLGAQALSLSGDRSTR